MKRHSLCLMVMANLKSVVSILGKWPFGVGHHTHISSAGQMSATDHVKFVNTHNKQGFFVSLVFWNCQQKVSNIVFHIYRCIKVNACFKQINYTTNYFF